VIIHTFHTTIYIMQNFAILPVFLFLTTWTFIMVVFHKTLHDKIDMLLISFIVMFIGLYLAHVNPKYFVLHTTDKEHIFLHDKIYIIISDLLHIVPFFFIYVLYGRYYTTNAKYILLLRSICILVLYFMIFEPTKIYHVDVKELMYVILITLALYITILMFIITHFRRTSKMVPS